MTMSRNPLHDIQGPFRAEQLKSGDPCEKVATLLAAGTRYVWPD